MLLCCNDVTVIMTLLLWSNRVRYNRVGLFSSSLFCVEEDFYINLLIKVEKLGDRDILSVLLALLVLELFRQKELVQKYLL